MTCSHGQHEQDDSRRRRLRGHLLQPAELSEERRQPDGDRGLRVGAEDRLDSVMPIWQAAM